MRQGILHRWGLDELAGPILGVVLVTIGCFTLLSNREARLRRQQADLVLMHNHLYQARAMLARGYIFYVLRHSGDTSVRPEQVLSYLDQSAHALDDALAQRGSWRPADRMTQELSPEWREVFENLRSQVMQFRAATVEALGASQSLDLDQRARYQLLIQQMGNQSDVLQTAIGDAFRKQDTVVRISIGIWAGSMAGVLLLLVMSSVRRSRTEKALRESEERFRATFNQAAVGIAHVGTDGKWLVVNDTLCQMLGYTADEMHTLRFQDITHADDLARDVQQVQRMLSGELNSYSMEKRYIHKSGEIIWVNLTVSLVRDQPGKSHYFISVVENITERKRIQADRDQLLERERRARADAESANRAKDHFLAVVSHELRTPLTPVTTGLDLLSRSKEVVAEHGETIAMMRRNIEAESQIISDLLDVVRLANNKLEIRRDILDLHRLLREVEQTFRLGMRGKRIEWKFEFAAQESLVQADSLRLTQVFTNLLGNAVKFTPEGGHISVRTSNVNGYTIRVEVKDSGIGIEPQVIQRLFKPFEQAEISLARRYGGLGLGLSIARSLLELHGGSLSAQSEGLGHGALFIIDLPVTAGPVSVKESMTARNITPQKRILVVEDNVDTAQALTRLLKSLGHEITVAKSGAEGLALAARGNFDLLLSDIGLPDFSGWELIRRLKQTRNLPAIALSGFGTEEDQRRSREAGFVAHLVKPIDIIRLENVINGIVAAQV